MKSLIKTAVMLGLTSALLSATSSAQTYYKEGDVLPSPGLEGIGAPPELSLSDAAGVDIISGLPGFTLNDLHIGSGVSQLSHSITSQGTGHFWGFWDDYRIRFEYYNETASPYFKMDYGHKSKIFYRDPADGSYNPIKEDGSTFSGSRTEPYLFTDEQGVEVERHDSGPWRFTITYPNGFKVYIKGNVRVGNVMTNTGLQLFYEYESDILDNNCPVSECSQYPHADWDDPYKQYNFPIKITALNNRVDYCSPNSDDCSFSRTWPSVDYSWPTWGDMFGANGTGLVDARFTVTGVNGETTTYHHKQYLARKPDETPLNLNDELPDPLPDFSRGGNYYHTRVFKVKSATSSGNATTTYDYRDFSFEVVRDRSVKEYHARHNLVKEAIVDGASYTYRHELSQEYRQFGYATTPRGNLSGVLALGGAYGFTIPRMFLKTGNGIQLDYDEGQESNRLEKSTEYGKTAVYEYDARGNITKKTWEMDNTQSNPASYTDIIYEAGYDTDCTNIKKCNKPNWIIDGKGNQTDYEYHPQSGQLSKVTRPANDAGIRPQTRYTYEQKYASFIQSEGGSATQSGDPIWMLTKESFCMKGSATANGCALTNDEVVTHYQYDDNLFLTGIIEIAEGKARKTCLQRNMLGQVVNETRSKDWLTVSGSTVPQCN